MKRYRILKFKLFGALLASIFIGGAAFAEITLPTAVLLDTSIFFQKPNGEPVQLKPGIYEVEQAGEKQLIIDPVNGGDFVTVQAIESGHTLELEEAKALLTPPPDNNDDRMHLVLWLPEGLALEAIGSYSGVFSRSALTWGAAGDSVDKTIEAKHTVRFEKAVYFKTIDGNPKAIQPGEYSVAMATNGLQLISTAGQGDAITIETGSLVASTAFLVPDFNNDPDLQLLLLETAEGEALVAIGSLSGTFPRGWKNWVKKKVRKAGKIAWERGKRAAKKACGSLEKGIRCARIAVKVVSGGAG